MPSTTVNDIDNGSEWNINDTLTHLREWGTERLHPLPVGRGECVIGTVEGCWLRLSDPTGRVSRLHARLTHTDDRWELRDLGSTNGVRFDGGVRPGCTLTPGVEIGIGGLTLVAESPRWCALREVMKRLLGWSADRQLEVDSAMRRVRTAARRRATLLLCGDGDLAQVARLLHHHALGDERPFILCDPKRRLTDRFRALNYRDTTRAMAEATGGTLCVRYKNLPVKFVGEITAALQPDSRVQLIACARSLLRSEPLVSSPIVIPPIRRRRQELTRIIDAYAADAIQDLGGEFSAIDRDWIQKHDAATLPEIELATRRLVALRAAGGVVSRAAQLLGMSHSALTDWLKRRRPTPVENDIVAEKAPRREQATSIQPGGPLENGQVPTSSRWRRRARKMAV